MAVIDTSMEMPEACNKETFRNGYYVHEHCKLFEACNKAVLFRKDYKPDNCPLKSVDGLIAELEDLAVLGDARPNISDGYHNAMKDVLEVVHKYCGGRTNE